MDDLIQQSFFASLEAGKLNEQQEELVKKTIRQMSDTMTRFRDAVAHIRSDGDLSNQGQQVKIASAAETARESILRISDPELERLDSRISEVAAMLTPQTPDEDQRVEFMKQREARDHLYAMNDELRVIELYQSIAINGTDDLTMRAIEGAPISFPLITDKKILEKGKTVRAERQSPDSAQLLKELKVMRNQTEAARNSALAELHVQDSALEAIAANG